MSRLQKDKRRALRGHKARPCSDCGREHSPEFMTFDHVRGTKVTTVSRMSIFDEYGLDDLEAEIAKCEVVCVWCHELREVARGRVAPGWGGLSRQALDRVARDHQRRNLCRS